MIYFLQPIQIASLICKDRWKMHLVRQLLFYKKVRICIIYRWLAQCHGIFLRDLRCQVELHRATYVQGIVHVYGIQKIPMLSHFSGGRGPNSSISGNSIIYLPFAQTVAFLDISFFLDKKKKKIQ